MTNKGTLYVIAAPSGAGKTTLVKALVESSSNIMVSISHTTRPKRPQEIHGINYYFVSREEFEHMIKDDDFLEYATVFENLYGTSKSAVKHSLDQGTDVILEIDWQGHQQVKRLFPDAVGIFILPPSLKDLRARLEHRDQDHPEVIEKRLKDAKETISHLSEFDYLVVNDNFDHALAELKIIISANRLRTGSQTMSRKTLIDSFS